MQLNISHTISYIIPGCDYVCAYVKYYSYAQILFSIFQPYLKYLYTDCRRKVVQILFAFYLCGCMYLHIEQHKNVAEIKIEVI